MTKLPVTPSTCKKLWAKIFWKNVIHSPGLRHHRLVVKIQAFIPQKLLTAITEFGSAFQRERGRENKKIKSLKPTIWIPNHSKYEFQKVWYSNGCYSDPHCICKQGFLCHVAKVAEKGPLKPDAKKSLVFRCFWYLSFQNADDYR